MWVSNIINAYTVLNNMMPAVCCLLWMQQSNPQLNAMVQANPQLAAMMADPEAMRRMMDPANMQVLWGVG